MNTRALKLVALFVLMAAVASALTVSYLLARPGGAPSGSVTGVVRLAGGAMTLGVRYYSDRGPVVQSGDFNVVRFTVEDSDLSSVRKGVARITIGGDISSADLTAGSTILEGEISRTDKFDGFRYRHSGRHHRRTDR